MKSSILWIKYILLLINLFALNFISIVVKEATDYICYTQGATTFMSSVNAIPSNPTMSYFLVMVLSAFLLFDFILRQFFIENEPHKIIITLLIDCVLTLFVLRIEDFNYNGIILWIIANIVYYIESRNRIFAIGLGIIGYIFSTHGLLAIYLPLYSIESYFFVYNVFVRNILFMIYYAISAFNLILFTIFCVYVIQEQKGIIEEVNQLYLQLSQANKELTKLANVKEKMGETRERNRIAREIHDTIGHSLMSISVGVDSALVLFDKKPDVAKKQLMSVSEVARDGIADVRRSVSALRPDAEGSHRLNQRICHLIDKTEQTTGITIHYTCHIPLMFEEDEENAIFRVIQESVTNAIKHGEATIVDIDISKGEHTLHITIQDNGYGCDHFVHGFGTTHMVERIKMLNGTIDFISEDGFKVVASVPIRNKKDDESESFNS